MSSTGGLRCSSNTFIFISRPPLLSFVASTGTFTGLGYPWEAAEILNVVRAACLMIKRRGPITLTCAEELEEADVLPSEEVIPPYPTLRGFPNKSKLIADSSGAANACIVELPSPPTVVAPAFIVLVVP